MSILDSQGSLAEICLSPDLTPPLLVLPPRSAGTLNVFSSYEVGQQTDGAAEGDIILTSHGHRASTGLYVASTSVYIVLHSDGGCCFCCFVNSPRDTSADVLFQTQAESNLNNIILDSYIVDVTADSRLRIPFFSRDPCANSGANWAPSRYAGAAFS